MVSSSDEDTTSDILLMQSRCVCWEIKHNRPVFHCGSIAMPNSESWGSYLSQVWQGDRAVIAASNACFKL